MSGLAWLDRRRTDQRTRSGVIRPFVSLPYIRPCHPKICLTFRAPRRFGVDALPAVRAPPVTARDKSESHAEWPEKDSEAEPEAAACSTTFRYNGRADSAEDPDNDGQYHYVVHI